MLVNLDNRFTNLKRDQMLAVLSDSSPGVTAACRKTSSMGRLPCARDVPITINVCVCARASGHRLCPSGCTKTSESEIDEASFISSFIYMGDKSNNAHSD